MYDDFAPRLARILTEFAQPVQEGDFVFIASNVEASPLVMALYEAVLRRGGNPMVQVQLPGLREMYMEIATDSQLEWVNPVMREVVERVDLFYSISAPANTKELTQIDPARMQLSQKASRELMQRYFERTASGDLRWNITGWPTEAGAQEAEMGRLAFTKFMYEACLLHTDDPVAEWEALRARQQRIVDWLADKQHLHVTGPGIDLRMEFGGRPWVNSWGSHNFPSGEVFTSPVEDSVNGTVAFNFPTVYGGRQINGVELRFEDGVVVEASAAKGEDYLLSQLDIDEGARRLGEFAIGTNYGIRQFVGNTLFDEKIGGTVHMALGRGFEESNGENKSQIHWDMVHNMKDGGRVTVDDELIYENGRFVREF